MYALTRWMIFTIGGLLASGTGPRRQAGLGLSDRVGALGVDLVALLEGHQIVGQAAAVFANEEPFVGVVVLAREVSAPVSGSAQDKGPHRCMADSRVVATSLTREWDGFRRNKVNHNGVHGSSTRP
jgi:hypothetical protein